VIAIRPGIKAVVASGEHPAEVKHAFSRHKIETFLPKPFQPNALATAALSAVAASSGQIVVD
jgi:glutamate 5-kinase